MDAETLLLAHAHFLHLLENEIQRRQNELKLLADTKQHYKTLLDAESSQLLVPSRLDIFQLNARLKLHDHSFRQMTCDQRLLWVRQEDEFQHLCVRCRDNTCVYQQHGLHFMRPKFWFRSLLLPDVYLCDLCPPQKFVFSPSLDEWVQREVTSHVIDLPTVAYRYEFRELGEEHLLQCSMETCEATARFHRRGARTFYCAEHVPK